MIDAVSAPHPVPLSVDRHGMRRWRRFTDYGFARAWQSVPVVLAEAEAVASAMPIVFSGADADVPEPVALLRLKHAATPFLDQAGQWLAPYVPALMRAYPFNARPAQGDDGRMILLVDEGGGFVTDNPDDQRFFDPFGAPSDALQAVVGFFQHYETSARATRTACAALAAEGLFVPLELAGNPADLPSGYWMIARERLSALDDAAFLRLRAAGALDLAHAHFVGRIQIDFLRRAEAALANGAVPGAPIAPTPGLTGNRGNTSYAAEAGLSDFLAALAAAQDDGAEEFAGNGPGAGDGSGDKGKP